MIKLSNISKKYKTRYGIKTVLKNINLIIKPLDRIGILGINGAGKSTLIRLIGGAEQPTAGKIESTMSISWPIGITGGLQGTLSGIDNFKLICRIYNKDINQNRNFLEEFTELGRDLYESVANYSTGMRTKLGLGISLLIDFDCYLIDEAIAVGDKNLQEKYKQLLDRRKNKSMVLVSHSEKQIIDNCIDAYVLDQGNLIHFESPISAINYYNTLKKLNV